MLTFSRLVARNLRYHLRGNLAVVLGVAVGAAVLTGALLVGDSLRGSLRERAERQLNGVTAALIGPRMIRAEVADALPGTAPVLLLQGSIQKAPANATDVPPRIARVAVYGIDQRFGLTPAVTLSHRVVERLGAKPGDTIELGVEKMANIPRSSLLGRRNADDVTASLRLPVAAVLAPDDPANDFGLTPSPGPPLNVFVPLAALQEKVGQKGRVNALLSRDGDVADLNANLRGALTLDDWGVNVQVPKRRKAYASVESRQLVLDPATVVATEEAARELGLRSERTMVYLANWIACGEDKIPYSVVAALDPSAADPLGPFLPPGSPKLADDEILLADWRDSPITNPKPGDTITLTFFQPELEAGAVETTATFKLRGLVPLEGVANDPDLTPPFPGITDKLNIGDWNPPFPYDNKRPKPRDEAYWNRYRTTPKAYITPAAGEKLFGSRFGSVTSIRVAPGPGETPQQAADRLKPAILAKLNPDAAGLAFEDVRARLLTASRGGTDFGGLFLGFSFFLIAAALMLVGLLFRLTLDRRAKEIGLLLAAGFAVRQVRRLLLAEGLLLAVLGTLLGLGLAAGYNRLMLDLLAALWPDPTVSSFLKPHAAPLSFGIGFAATVLMAVFAVWLGTRGLVRVPPPALLRGETTAGECRPLAPRAVGDSSGPNPQGRDGAAATARGASGRHSGTRWSRLTLLASAPLGVALLAAGGFLSNPDFRAMSFFGGGALLLTAGLAAVWVWMHRTRNAVVNGRGFPALVRLGARNAARNPVRSILTAGLLASAAFLLVAVESFRRTTDPDFLDENGGSGGFNLVAEADVPVFEPFDSGNGRADLEDRLQTAFGGSSADPRFAAAKTTLEAIAPDADGPRVFPLRLRGGDDASCLNLYQAGRPRLLGVPDSLVKRGGFKFSATLAKTPEEKANPWLLLDKLGDDCTVPVFVEQNTAMWMLKTGLGGTVTLPDETGKDVAFRVVGTLVDSPFQSELLVGGDHFRKLFPHEEGFRVFLVRTPPGEEGDVQRVLETGLRANGFVATPTREKVAAYQAVIGAYLSTFQVLGGFGLLLGVCGLAVVILRGVWERQGELALMRAVGYTPRALLALVLGENALLLCVGLGVGVLAALASVAPHLAGGGSVPWGRLAAMLGGVLGAGLLVATAATAGILRVPLIPALRRE